MIRKAVGMDDDAFETRMTPKEEEGDEGKGKKTRRIILFTPHTQTVESSPVS